MNYPLIHTQLEYVKKKQMNFDLFLLTFRYFYVRIFKTSSWCHNGGDFDPKARCKSSWFLVFSSISYQTSPNPSNFANSRKCCRSSKLFKVFTKSYGILLIVLWISLFNAYTMVVQPISFDVIIVFDTDDKNIFVIFTVCY